MAKKKSRLKKILKKLGKVAMLGGAAYGASKLFGGTKGNVLKTAASEDANIPDRSFSTAKRLMTQPLAYNKREPIYPDPIRTGGVGVKGPGSRTWDSYLPWNTDRYKKGGRVTGIAKRGFGRALMKGKK
jgi:hypothetical protein